MVRNCSQLFAEVNAYRALALAATRASPAAARTLVLDCAGVFNCTDESRSEDEGRDLIMKLSGHGSLTIQVTGGAGDFALWCGTLWVEWVVPVRVCWRSGDQGGASLAKACAGALPVHRATHAPPNPPTPQAGSGCTTGNARPRIAGGLDTLPSTLFYVGVVDPTNDQDTGNTALLTLTNVIVDGMVTRPEDDSRFPNRGCVIAVRGGGVVASGTDFVNCKVGGGWA